MRDNLSKVLKGWLRRGCDNRLDGSDVPVGKKLPADGLADVPPSDPTPGSLELGRDEEESERTTLNASNGAVCVSGSGQCRNAIESKIASSSLVTSNLKQPQKR